MDPMRREKTIQQRPALVMELVGPACAGKTTLTRTLTQCSTKMVVARDISVRRPDHLAVFVRDAPRLLPVLLPGYHNSRSFTWEEIKSMVYLKAWSHVLRQQAANNHAVMLLDQGPVFRMATLHAFGPAWIRTAAADMWWNEMFKQWAAFLDVVIWLDAPNPLLVKRINARDRWHAVKNKSDREASQFLDRYRMSYQLVLTRLSVNGGPRVIPFDTGHIAIPQLVNAILAACNVERDRD
jgi:shikimate kinase